MAQQHAGRVFPRHVPLDDPDEPPHVDAAAFEALSCAKAKLSDVVDAAYWARLCPELTVSHPGSADAPGAASRPFDVKSLTTMAMMANARVQEVAAHVQQGVDEEGVAVAHRDQLPWEGIDFTLLAQCIVRLMQHGWPATFILMYDEVWSLIHQLGGLMDQATGNRVNMDILAWYVDPNRGHAGFSPHRDRQPEDVKGSFRPDGSARYTTAWVPLTDACPENSCLYVLPKWADPGYTEGDAEDGPDPLPLALATKESYQHLRALPVEAGGAVIFTHRIIHWGSKGRQGFHTPRVALSFGCADDEFEPAYFSRQAHLPFPSVAMRAALAAAQMIAYHERFDLTPKQLAMFRRVFEAKEGEFHPTYRAKILQEYVSASADVTQRHAAKQQQQPQQPPGKPAATHAHPHEQQHEKEQQAEAPHKQRKRKHKDPPAAAAAAAPPTLEAPVPPKGKPAGRSKPAGEEQQQLGAGAAAAAAAAAKKPTKKQKKQGAEGEAAGGAAAKPAPRGKEAGGQDKRPVAAAAATAAAAAVRRRGADDDEEEDEEEEEGPGFEFVLGGGEAGEVDSDVDLLDDALEAVLAAKQAGFDDGVQDDFGSDMERDDYEQEEDDEEDAPPPQAAKKHKKAPKPSTPTPTTTTPTKPAPAPRAAATNPAAASPGLPKKKAKGPTAKEGGGNVRRGGQQPQPGKKKKSTQGQKA